jgi:hypothetical protein
MRNGQDKKRGQRKKKTIKARIKQLTNDAVVGLSKPHSQHLGDLMCRVKGITTPREHSRWRRKRCGTRSRCSLWVDCNCTTVGKG